MVNKGQANRRSPLDNKMNVRPFNPYFASRIYRSLCKLIGSDKVDTIFKDA